MTAIPYRTGTPVSMGNLVMAGLVTLLVLTLLVGLLVYLRRRGWGGGWVVCKQTIRDRGIEVRTSRRFGPCTTAHVIAYQGAEYLVVENGRGSTATVLSLDAYHDGTGSAP